jgi:hypothetical protein
MLAVLPVILGVQFLLQALLLDVQSVPDRPLHSTLAFVQHAVGDVPAR